MKQWISTSWSVCRRFQNWNWLKSLNESNRDVCGVRFECCKWVIPVTQMRNQTNCRWILIIINYNLSTISVSALLVTRVMYSLRLCRSQSLPFDTRKTTESRHRAKALVMEYAPSKNNCNWAKIRNLMCIKVILTCWKSGDNRDARYSFYSFIHLNDVIHTNTCLTSSLYNVHTMLTAQFVVFVMFQWMRLCDYTNKTNTYKKYTSI